MLFDSSLIPVVGLHSSSGFVLGSGNRLRIVGRFLRGLRSLVRSCDDFGGTSYHVKSSALGLLPVLRLYYGHAIE
jgi:hypothetical protein